MSLSALSDELAQVRIKKNEFLAEIRRIVPWGEGLSLFQPYYYKESMAISPMIWNECCGSIWCRICMTCRIWRQ